MNQSNNLRRFPGLIFVATPIGSPGKTTVSQIIEYGLLERNLFVDLYSFGSSSRDNVSKVRRVLPRTLDIPFGASMREIADNPELAVQHFDKTGALMSYGGALFDFGANVAPAFFSWAPVSGLYGLYGRLPPITLVVPVTASSVSIDGAFEIISDARKSLKDLPVQKVIIVYNERDGEFSGRMSGYAKLKIADSARVAGIRISSIVLPLLESDIWKAVQMVDMNFAEILSSSREELKVRLDLPIIECGRGRNIFRNWLQNAVEDFKKVDIFP